MSELTSSEARTPADVSNAAQSVLTTIAGHTITAAPTAVAVVGNTLNPGDLGVTLGGTPLAFNKAGYISLGSKTIQLTSGLAQTITITISNQPVTPNSITVVMKGTTLRASDPGVIVDKIQTATSLNTKSMEHLYR